MSFVFGFSFESLRQMYYRVTAIDVKFTSSQKKSCLDESEQDFIIKSILFLPVQGFCTTNDL